MADYIPLIDMPQVQNLVKCIVFADQRCIIIIILTTVRVDSRFWSESRSSAFSWSVSFALSSILSLFVQLYIILYSLYNFMRVS